MNIDNIGNQGQLVNYLDSLGFNAAEIQDISKLVEADPSKMLEIIENFSASMGSPVGGEIPELDLPQALDFIQGNLEKILGLLQMECDEEQIQLAKDRIESMKDKIKANHEEQLEKIADQLEEAKKAEKNSKAAEIFGWIGVALAIVSAIVAIALTGGATAGVAIAGALLAITTMALEQEGKMEEFGKALLESIEKTCPNWSKKAQMQFAAAAQILVMIACSALIIAGGGLATGLPKMPAMVSKVVAEACATGVNAFNTGVGLTLGLGNLGISTAGAVLNNDATELSAEVKDIQAFLIMLQQTMDEEQEIIQELMQDLQNSIGSVITLLEKDNDNMTQLINNLGANAAMV